jgi:hypothetical protein
MYPDFPRPFQRLKVAASAAILFFHGAEARAPKEQELDVGLLQPWPQPLPTRQLARRRNYHLDVKLPRARSPVIVSPTLGIS